MHIIGSNVTQSRYAASRYTQEDLMVLKQVLVTETLPMSDKFV